MHHSPFNHTPDSLFCPLPRSYLSSPLPRLFPLSSAKIFVPAFLLQQKISAIAKKRHAHKQTYRFFLSLYRLFSCRSFCFCRCLGSRRFSSLRGTLFAAATTTGALGASFSCRFLKHILVEVDEFYHGHLCAVS